MVYVQLTFCSRSRFSSPLHIFVPIDKYLKFIVQFFIVLILSRLEVRSDFVTGGFGRWLPWRLLHRIDQDSVKPLLATRR